MPCYSSERELAKSAQGLIPFKSNRNIFHSLQAADSVIDSLILHNHQKTNPINNFPKTDPLLKETNPSTPPSNQNEDLISTKLYDSLLDQINLLTKIDSIDQNIKIASNLLNNIETKLYNSHNVPPLLKIATSGLNNSQKENFMSFAKRFSQDILFTDSVYTSSIVATYLVVPCDLVPLLANSRTIKYLQAILVSCWIVSFDWIHECLQSNKIVDCAKYEVIGCEKHSTSYGPKKSRQQKQQTTKNGISSQFCFRQNFLSSYYFILASDETWNSPNRDEVSTLIEIAGGIVLQDLNSVSEITSGQYRYIWDYTYIHPTKKHKSTNSSTTTNNENEPNVIVILSSKRHQNTTPSLRQSSVEIGFSPSKTPKPVQTRFEKNESNNFLIKGLYPKRDLHAKSRSETDFIDYLQVYPNYSPQKSQSDKGNPKYDNRNNNENQPTNHNQTPAQSHTDSYPSKISFMWLFDSIDRFEIVKDCTQYMVF
ncbi:hypothetical protein BB559_002004 [Furculomyces boomerangus]|uniref:BRCT domain-containing protein n=1 Tax=Furculomyces boomerangus TaxID=61424 RepID=A0A2T9YYU1_9FUNG|nr:hypothetical protein BB559_002004 [Furculomyces boomerangus]